MAEYDAQQRATAPIPVMPQRLLYCLLALTGLAAGCITWNVLITRHYWNPRIEIVSEVLDALAMNRTQIDVVFVGSSRLNSGVDPLILDARNDAAGTATTSFTFWIPDTAAGDLDFMLETLREIELPQLEYVVIEPRLLPVPASVSTFRGLAYSGYSTRLRYIYDLARTEKLLGMVLAASSLTVSDAKNIVLLTAMGLANFSNLGVLPDILLPYPDKTARDSSIALHRGHKPSKPSSARKFELGEPQMDVREYAAARQFDALTLDYLLGKIESMSATPVVFLPPIRSGVGREKALRDLVRTNFPGLLILDYTDLAGRGGLLYDDENWIDEIHLSLEGSERLSEQLSKDWLDR